MKLVTNFILYSRVHTVIGTVLSLTSLYLIALSLSPDLEQLHLAGYILTLISCLGANIYIVGLNQVSDVEIDKINKPYLPLASGAYTMRTGYIINTIALIISVSVAFYVGRYLLVTVLTSLFIGTIYSLRPIRLKRYYFWAAFCIIAVRGLVVNIFLFMHLQFMVVGFNLIPNIIWLLTAAIFMYSIVIAWFKDIPDMEGDQQHMISTLTLRMGSKNVFITGNIIIILTLIALIIIPFTVAFPINNMAFAALHFIMLAALLVAIYRTDIGNKKSMPKFYQFIWVLFFMEYITFAIACLLAPAALQ